MPFFWIVLASKKYWSPILIGSEKSRAYRPIHLHIDTCTNSYVSFSLWLCVTYLSRKDFSAMSIFMKLVKKQGLIMNDKKHSKKRKNRKWKQTKKKNLKMKNKKIKKENLKERKKEMKMKRKKERKKERKLKRWVWFGLVCLVLWHINLCRLFNAKSIFM